MHINYNRNYILENDVVCLRPLEMNDYENLLSFAIEEPDLWRFSAISAAGAAGMNNYITQAVCARNDQKEYPFIVFDKRINAYAGSTRFYDIQPINKVLQLGYTWYGSKFQSTGLNKNCKFLLLQFAFDTLGCERVEFRADKDNEKSVAAMKSIGCVMEGILRSNMPRISGRRRDSVVLSILKSEWQEQVKDKLQKAISLTKAT